ncbi:vitamin K epoxide reductase family protein [Candidatus Nomurabacteria bacterium]|nr:vitamin K epoxide reductase family protein [Candidatus Nomurabacteria bacterium]
MKLLKKLWSKRFKATPKFVPSLLLLFASIGVADAAYLTLKHLRGAYACSFSTGCADVLTSKYATIYGVPIAILGLVYYLGIVALTLWYMDKKSPLALTLLSHATWAGFLVSIYLVSLQLFVINAICTFCIVSATTSTLLFILGQYIAYYCHKTKQCDYKG